MHEVNLKIETRSQFSQNEFMKSFFSFHYLIFIVHLAFTQTLREKFRKERATAQKQNRRSRSFSA
jgi:hypothetical protein